MSDLIFISDIIIEPTPTPDTTNTVITLPFAPLPTLSQPELLSSPLVTYNTTPQSMSPGISQYQLIN